MSETDKILNYLEEILQLLLGDKATPEEVIRFWFFLGRYIGVEKIFPHLKVVVTPDENEEIAVVLLLGSPSEALVEVLAGDSIMKEGVVKIALEDYKAMKNGGST